MVTFITVNRRYRFYTTLSNSMCYSFCRSAFVRVFPWTLACHLSIHGVIPYAVAQLLTILKAEQTKNKNQNKKNTKKPNNCCSHYEDDSTNKATDKSIVFRIDNQDSCNAVNGYGCCWRTYYSCSWLHTLCCTSCRLTICCSSCWSALCCSSCWFTLCCCSACWLTLCCSACWSTLCCSACWLTMCCSSCWLTVLLCLLVDSVL